MAAQSVCPEMGRGFDMTTTEDRRSPWRRSTACVNNDCVEAATLGGQVAVRNSQDPDARIRFTQAAWKHFVSAAPFTRDNRFVSTSEDMV